MKKEERKAQKGITLVALVVTVIVLLILAGVTIMTLFGENGLISMAQKAKSETENAQVNTIAEIDSLIDELNSVLIGNGNSGGTPIEVEVDGLGKVEINVPDEVNDPDKVNNQSPEITYDPDTGETGGVIPPAEDVPETPVEIPEEKLPELIEFTYGKLESNSTYTPGTYETVPFEETYTRPKYPVSYQGFVWSKWNVTKDADGNITNVVPKNIELATIDKKYSTYIIYDFETEKYLEMEDVKGDSVELWTIYNNGEDTLDNIIYLAAYLKKTDGKTTRHIAKWDGSKYVAVDYDAQVNAVDTFTETGTISGTKKVEITAPSTSVDYVYVPVGTMKAEKGMTWVEWLASDYNTSGYAADAVVKDDNGNTIDKGTQISANGKFSIEDSSGGNVDITSFYLQQTNSKNADGQYTCFKIIGDPGKFDIYYFVQSNLIGAPSTEEELISNASKYSINEELDRVHGGTYVFIYLSENGGQSIDSPIVRFNTTSICFDGDTYVNTTNGLKEIKDVHIGEKVYSYNEKLNKIEEKRVVNVFKNRIYAKLCEISANNEKIKCTSNHPFYLNGNWVKACELKKNDILKNQFGRKLAIDNVSMEKNEHENIVYNLEVEDNHNYFVGSSCFLVHNKPALSCSYSGTKVYGEEFTF